MLKALNDLVEGFCVVGLFYEVDFRVVRDAEREFPFVLNLLGILQVVDQLLDLVSFGVSFVVEDGPKLIFLPVETFDLFALLVEVVFLLFVE